VPPEIAPVVVILPATVASKTAAHPYNGDGSSSAYFLNGIESPALQLQGVDGTTANTEYFYKFDQAHSSNSGHPLRFYKDAAKAEAYTSGVTTNGTAGSSGAFTTIAVDDATPNVLYYECSSHAYMGNYVTTPATSVQGLDAELTAIAGLTSAADKGIQFTGSGTAGVYDLTAAGKALLDDADASAQRTTLGLGTAATQAVGTSASNVVQLDGSAKLPAVDGSALTNLVAGGIINKVADGDIAIRKPVVLTSAGKAKQVAETSTTNTSPTVANVTAMDGSDTTNKEPTSAYESNSGTYSIAYRDTSNSNYGTVVCGTWSNGTMTWGTPVAFVSAAISTFPTITAGGNRIHVAFKAANKGQIISASISGTTPTFAAASVWGQDKSVASGGRTELGSGTIDNLCAVYDTGENRIVTFYGDDGNSLYGTAVVSQITNATTGAMTYGTPVVFNSSYLVMSGRGAVYDTSTSRVVVSYMDDANNKKGAAIVGQVTAGTNSIAFGSETVFATDTKWVSAVEDPNTDRIAVFYSDTSDSSKGKGIVGTVTGGTTNSIAFGSATEFESTAINFTSGVYGASVGIGAAYEPDTHKILIAYNDGATNGQARVATVTGGGTNTIAYGTEVEFTTGNSDYPAIAYDTNTNKFVVAYMDRDDSSKGKMVAATISGTNVSFQTIANFTGDSTTRISTVYDPISRYVVIAFQNNSQTRLELNFASTNGTTPQESSNTTPDGDLNNARFISAIYDEDNKRVVIAYAPQVDNDLSHLVLLPNTGSGPVTYKIAYDSDTNYVILIAEASGNGSDRYTYIYPIYHDTSNGTYTVGERSLLKSGAGSTGAQVYAYAGILYDPDADRTIIAYMDDANSNEVTANVIQSTGSSSAPTVTIGSNVLVDSGDDGSNIAMTYDTTNNKVFLAYENTTEALWKGTIGTVTAGTNSISFTGTATIWDNNVTGQDQGEVSYDSDANKILFFYRADAVNNYTTYKVITPGSSSFSVADGAAFSNHDSFFNGGASSFGAGKGTLLPTYNSTDSNKLSYGTAFFATTTTTTTPLDNGNYLGIAAEAISDTATGKINVIGGTSTGHSSLTIGNHYFTNGAGTIGLVGNTTGEQYLGRAISATEIQLL
jgi:hypothetical protein